MQTYAEQASPKDLLLKCLLNNDGSKRDKASYDYVGGYDLADLPARH